MLDYYFFYYFELFGNGMIVKFWFGGSIICGYLALVTNMNMNFYSIV